MTRDEAIDIIGWVLGSKVEDTLYDGLPGGDYEVWGYDDELVNDLGEACKRFNERKAK